MNATPTRFSFLQSGSSLSFLSVSTTLLLGFGLISFRGTPAHAGKGSACEESAAPEYKDAQGERNGGIPCLTREGKVMRRTTWVHGNQTGPETSYDPASGEPLSEINWKNNRLDGPSRKFSARTHQLLTETHYKDGKKDGSDKEWFDAPLAYAPKLERNYVDDTLDGPTKEYSAPHTPANEGSYKHGRKDGPWKRYSPQGKYVELNTFREGTRDGLVRKFDPDTGNILSSECWKNGTATAGSADCAGNPNGSNSARASGGREKQVENYPSGKKRREYEAKNGQKDGVERAYLENGQLSEQFTYVNGKKSGPAKTFYDSGKPESEVTYRDGLFAGELKTYFEETGTPKSVVTWHDGKKDGLTREYYMNGKPSRETEFARGQHRHEVDYFDNGQKSLEQGWDDEGELTGPNRDWNKAGVLIDDGTYAHDKREGTRKLLDPESKTLVTEHYVQGTLKRRETLKAATGKPKIEEFYPDGSSKTVSE